MNDGDDPRDSRTAVAKRKHAAASEPSATERATGTGVGGLPRRKVDPSVRDLASRIRKKRRYRLRKMLGRGGMGEVYLARDVRIGRTVAMKVMLAETAPQADLQQRFLREARVQGQLEHPAIVPVHDLGWDRDGRPYFAMKRISGDTVADVLRALRGGEPGHVARYSLRNLLSMFQRVCLAIDYAHARGVVHRDIKPSNLMLGDFGEVYVLDWGIAKVLDTEDLPSGKIELERPSQDATGQGEVLGTIGYMSPEQLMNARSVDGRSDVYSLGAVLFEILALAPLHAGSSDETRARSTLDGIDARASLRAPERDVPPELDVACVKATALDPGERFASARALHDAVEDFLEGDRDVRLRADVAARHVARAREAAQRALTDAADASEQRRVAIRDAGRALALDPNAEAAADILARLMLEPPKEVPPEVRARTDAVAFSEMQRGVRLGALALLPFTLIAVAFTAPGIRSWPGLASIAVPLLVAVVYGLFVSRADPRRFRAHTLVLSVLIAAAIAGGSGLLGPLLLAPTFALGVAALIAVYHSLGRYRIPMIAFTCAAWAVPAALEWAGVWRQAYRFDAGTMVILPQVTVLPETQVRIVLGAGNFLIILFVCALLAKYGAWVAESRERLFLHAWHLQSLAPHDRSTATKD